MEITDIGVLARRMGISASAIRYYEEIGLITSIGRRGLRRQFGPEAAWQLALIGLGKQAGFSLAEIAEMFGGDMKTLPRERLQDKAAEIDAQINDLTVLRDTIRHVADCPASSHYECPRFRKLMRIAADRSGRSRHTPCTTR